MQGNFDSQSATKDDAILLSFLQMLRKVESDPEFYATGQDLATLGFHFFVGKTRAHRYFLCAIQTANVRTIGDLVFRAKFEQRKYKFICNLHVLHVCFRNLTRKVCKSTL